MYHLSEYNLSELKKKFRYHVYHTKPNLEYKINIKLKLKIILKFAQIVFAQNVFAQKVHLFNSLKLYSLKLTSLK